MTNLNAAIMVALVLLLTVPLTGCGGSKDPRARIAELNSSNIIRLRSCYTIFSLYNSGPPKDEKSFRNFFETDTTAIARLKRIGVQPEDFANIFVSQRDDQPFIIRWNVGGKEDEAIIFEAQGVNGKRMVAFNTPRELDDQEYEGYLNGELKP